MAAAAAVPAGGRGHGMLSVVGLSDADLDKLCREAREQLGGDTVCQIANYLFPQVRCGEDCAYTPQSAELLSKFALVQPLARMCPNCSIIFCQGYFPTCMLCCCRVVLCLVMLTRLTWCPHQLKAWEHSRPRGWRSAGHSTHDSWPQQEKHC